MSDLFMTPQDVEKKGQLIYEQKLKDKLERKHFGKYVAIEVHSGGYFIGDSVDAALTLARKKYPNKIFHSIKIGSEGIFKASGFFSRNDKNEWVF